MITKNNKGETVNTVYTVKVLSVREIKGRPDCYRFNAEVNGVTIYGMSYVTYQDNKTGTKRNFISFPSYKGSDDKFYNVCYFKIEDGSDTFKSIESQIERMLNDGKWFAVIP